MGLGVQQINKYEQAQFLFVNDRQKHITNTINKKIQKKLAVVSLFSLFVPLFDSWKVRYVRLFVCGIAGSDRLPVVASLSSGFLS